MRTTHDELMAVAGRPTVPGTPLTLRISGWRETPGAVPRVGWHFDDPRYDHAIVPGTTAVRGTAEQVWADVQLDAAWVLHDLTDSDWTPGVAPTRRTWTADEAWQALLDHLGRGGRDVAVSGDEVRGPYLTLRGVTPVTWAAYLNAVDDRPLADTEPHGHVAVGRIEGEGLPLWADDRLSWGFGDAPVLDLVDGELTDPRRAGGPTVRRFADYATEHETEAEAEADALDLLGVPDEAEAWLRPRRPEAGVDRWELTVLVPRGSTMHEVAWADGTAAEVRAVLEEHGVERVYALEQVARWRRVTSLDDLDDDLLGRLAHLPEAD